MGYRNICRNVLRYIRYGKVQRSYDTSNRNTRSFFVNFSRQTSVKRTVISKFILTLFNEGAYEKSQESLLLIVAQIRVNSLEQPSEILANVLSTSKSQVTLTPWPSVTSLRDAKIKSSPAKSKQLLEFDTVVTILLLFLVCPDKMRVKETGRDCVGIVVIIWNEDTCGEKDVQR